MKAEGLFCDHCARRGRQTLATDALTIRSATGRTWRVDVCPAHLLEFVGDSTPGLPEDDAGALYRRTVLELLGAAPDHTVPHFELVTALGATPRDRRLVTTLRALAAAGAIVTVKRASTGRNYRLTPHAAELATAAAEEAPPPPTNGHPPRRTGAESTRIRAAVLATLAAKPDQSPGTMRAALRLDAETEFNRLRWALGTMRRAGLVVSRGKTAMARYRLTARGAQAAKAAAAAAAATTD